MNRFQITVFSSALCVAVSCFASTAHARVTQDLPYAPDVTWNAAIRMIRVDMGFSITERDRESGFVLFTYRDAARNTAGSIEFVPTTIDGVQGVRAIVQLPAMPSYAERHLLTRLDRKLHEEYGEPRRPPRTAPTPSQPRNPEGNSPPPGDGTPAPNAPREGEAPANRPQEQRNTNRQDPLENRSAFQLGNDR